MIAVPDQPYFNTGELARLAGYSTSTIRKCIDAGDLGVIRFPGTRRYRKIPREAAVAFLRSLGHEIENERPE